MSHLAEESPVTADGPIADFAGDPSSPARAVARFARQHPDRVAVDTAVGELTYRELDGEVERVARGLLERAAPGARIGMRFVTAHEMVVALLAIDRAGMVAVPIDPTSPGERLATVLTDVGARLLLIDIPADCVDAAPCPVVAIADVPHPEGGPRVDVRCSDDDLAVLVPTSGSMGVPKSVMITRSSRRASNDHIAMLGMEDVSRFGCVFAGSLGAATGMLTPPLTFGATLVTYHIAEGLSQLGHWLNSARIDCFSAVPTLLRHILDTLPAGFTLPDLSLIAVFGESATWRDVERLSTVLGRGAHVVNAYASSEAGLISTFRFEIGEPIPGGDTLLPVGRPVHGRDVVIHDENGAALPAGAAGEIVVAGRGLNTGYWGRPDLTSRVFVDLGDGRRMVRTGDRGRLLTDGSFEHLGRVDHMVKIAGNRIELGEVETALGALDGVSAAAATTRPDPAGHGRLLAWVVPERDADPSPSTLRAALARSLPGFMLPDAIMVVDELPRLPGGKVDRAALPDRALEPAAGKALVGDPARQLVSAVFTDVLGVQSAGPDDDFFELGGDSLRAARAMNELELRAGIVGPASLLLEHPTVAGLADAVRGGRELSSSLVPVRAGGDRVPLALIHGIKGQTVWARAVADGLPPDLPIYAFGSPLLGGRREDLTVAGLAHRYVRELRQARPQGPYVVFGFSFGGLVALEMGRELRAGGAQVTVLLGDTASPSVMGSSGSPRRRWERRFADARSLGVRRGARSLARAAVGDARAGTARSRVRRASTVGDRVPVAVRAEWVEMAHEKMARDHKPEPYDGPVVLLRSADGRRVLEHLWHETLVGNFRVVDIPGGHMDIVRPPHANDLASAILRELEKMTSDSIAGHDHVA